MEEHHTALPERTMVSHYPPYLFLGVITPYTVIREGDWKLIRWYEWDTLELYNFWGGPQFI